MNEDREIYMKCTIKSQFDFLKSTMMTSLNLEIFLRYCHLLSPYSVRNVLLLMSQSNGNISEVHGSDDWRKLYGATVLNGAQPYSIFAPPDGRSQDFSVAWVYDVSDTSLLTKPKKNLPRQDEHLNLLNVIAQGMKLKLVYSTFSNNFTRPVVIRKGNVIYMNKNLSNRINTLLVLRELCLEKLNVLTNCQKRAVCTDYFNKAVACCATFEIADWLEENPPKINAQAKNIILNTGLFTRNVKEINQIAFYIIKDIKNVLYQNVKKESKIYR